MTIGIDLGMSGAITARSTKIGEVVDLGRFRTTLSGVEKWFTDPPRAPVAMETGTHSLWSANSFRNWATQEPYIQFYAGTA